MPNHFAGVPVGLPIVPVRPGFSATFATQVEHTMVLTRLRWSIATPGLVLISAFVHKAALAGTMYATVPLLALDQGGLWRFPAVVAQASVTIGVVVENTLGETVCARAIAFWGQRWEDLTYRERSHYREKGLT